MAIYQLMVGTGLLSPKEGSSSAWGPPLDNNRQKFYDYMHESKDMYVVIVTPRNRDWKPFLEAYPDFAEKFIHYEMPYAVSNALHMEDHKLDPEKLGLVDSRRTKLVILKGGKCED